MKNVLDRVVVLVFSPAYEGNPYGHPDAHCHIPISLVELPLQQL
jgi:hypothetical protein